MASRAPTPPVKDIVITSEDPELVEILKEIKQILDIREGRLGDDAYRFIDYDELIRILVGDETIVITVLPSAHSHPHNDLTGIQGTGPDYYHLTLAEYGALGTHPDHNDLAVIQGGSPTERYHLTAAQHGNLHAPNIIEQLNSKVEVIDAGAGSIKAFVDGGERMELLAGSQTFGWILGESIEVQQTSNWIKFKIGGADELIVDGTRIQLPTGLLETNTGTPLDLTIDCGTQKTVVLEQIVWKDITVSGAQLSKPASSAPDQDTFRDEGGIDTDIVTLAFAVGEKASGSFEIEHDYKEGSDVTFHVLWQGIAAPTGTDFVKWELTYVFTRDGQTLDAPTTISVETPFDTQYAVLRSTFPTISGSTGGNNGGPLQITDQMLVKVERVAAAGDAYAGDALACEAGLRYQVDTLGSRQIGVK